ncbi:MAG: ATP-binding protein [Lentisphaeria bacterium]
MGTFVCKNIYEFDYVALDEENNGDVYIYLKYDNQATLPGFGMFVYRVKAYPFQYLIPPEKFPKKIPCIVNKLIPSRFNPEQQELFPSLSQDRNWLLPQFYVPGFTYKFSVTGKDSTGKYILKDLDSGIDHYHYESATPLNIGDSLERIIQAINGSYLVLAENRFAALQGTGFRVGQKHRFTIRKNKFDEENRRFLQLVDKFRGFWHRFYLEDDEALPDSDDIELEIGEITKPGWLCLQYPGNRLADMQKIRQSEVTDFGREDDQREFKTSIVFPPDGSNAPDFNHQLRHNILRVIASFLNSSGGQLFIGVDDSGVVSGIEGDLPYLNQDETDEYNGQYSSTTDSYEQKINNAISKELGEFAGSLISTRFFKTNTEPGNSKEIPKVFCEITVKPASSPVYLHGSILIVRAGNSCRQLRNGDITSFVLDRMRNQHPLLQSTVPPPPAATLKLAENSSASELNGIVPLSPPPKETTVNWGHLSFFADGTRQFGKPVQDSDLVAAVQLIQKHRQSKYRLLQCYVSGNVNVVDELAKKVPATKNKRYKNSWNSSDQLAQVFACRVDDYLVIRSIDKEGAPRLKAIQVNEIGVHDNLTAQGNALLPESEAKVTGYQLVPERFSSFIYDIIAKGRYTGPGENATLVRVQDCLAFLEQQQKQKPKNKE